MTIQDLTPEIYYTGTGNVTGFSFAFEADESDDIFAAVDGADTAPFTVTMNPDQESNPGGIVEFDVAPEANAEIRIYRATDVTQETAYPAFNRFPAESHEKALDKLTMLVQEIWQSVTNLWKRAVVFPELDPLNNVLPTVDERKGMYFVFDGSGRPTVTDQTSEGVSGVQTIVAGINIAVNDTDPENPIISALGGDGGGILEIIEGKNVTVDATDPERPIVSAADTLIEVHNSTGAPLVAGKVVHPAGSFTGSLPNVEYAIADSFETIDAGIAVVVDDIPDGADGFVSNGSNLTGLDTSGLSLGAVYLSSTVAGDVSNTIPEFANYRMKVGTVNKVDPVDGEMIVSLEGSPANTVLNFWNGVFRESFDFLVTSDGAVITGTLSPSNGHPNLTAIFSDGLYTFITTPAATTPLTAGTSTAPVTNYVFIPKSTKLITVSTTAWPTYEHIRIAEVVLQSAVDVQSDGALRNQNINDPVQDTTEHQGHLSHITSRIRTLPASWETGTAASLSVSADPSDLYLAITSGTIHQMHVQTFQAVDMSLGDHVHVINDPATPYTKTTNLNTITVDSNGDSLNNRWFSLVVWGVTNKSGERSPVMVNLPSGSYGPNQEAGALADADGLTNYTVPRQFNGVGFLIARITLKKNGTAWEYDPATGFLDLRGFTPNTTAGSSTGASGVTEYLGLSDTPSSYVGEAGKVPIVNAGETAQEFGTAADIGPYGVAALDVNGYVQDLNLPPLAITDVFPVASEVDQLALIVQRGDVAVRTDENKSYMRNSGTAGDMTDWTLLLFPPGVTSFNGRSGVVSPAVGDYSTWYAQLGTDVNFGDLTVENTITLVNPATPANTSLIQAFNGSNREILSIYAKSSTLDGGSLTMFGGGDVFASAVTLANGTGNQVEITPTGIALTGDTTFNNPVTLNLGDLSVNDDLVITSSGAVTVFAPSMTIEPQLTLAQEGTASSHAVTKGYVDKYAPKEVLSKSSVDLTVSAAEIGWSTRTIHVTGSAVTPIITLPAISSDQKGVTFKIYAFIACQIKMAGGGSGLGHYTGSAYNQTTTINMAAGAWLEGTYVINSTVYIHGDGLTDGAP